MLTRINTIAIFFGLCLLGSPARSETDNFLLTHIGFKWTEKTQRPLVISVTSSSDARNSGFRAGDLIKTIGGMEVFSQAEATYLLKGFSGNQKVRVLVDRKKPRPTTLTLSYSHVLTAEEEKEIQGPVFDKGEHDDEEEPLNVTCSP